jgi:transposase
VLRGPDVVRFLRYLLHRIAGKLLVIRDGSPIQGSKAVKGFVNNGASSRLQLEQLPSYAPESNPDERIWKHPKRVELKKYVSCQNLYELRSELGKAKERLRHERRVTLGCIGQLGLETEASAKRQVLHE